MTGPGSEPASSRSGRSSARSSPPPHQGDRPRGPGADAGVGVGQQLAQGGEGGRPRLAAEGVGGVGMEGGIGDRRQAALADRHHGLLLEAEERGEKAGPALRLRQGEERLEHVDGPRLELPQRLDGQRPRLAVGVAHRGVERPLRLRVAEHPERERRRPPHRRHVVDQQPLERAPPLGVRDAPERGRQLLAQRGVPLERLLHHEAVDRLAVDQQQQQRPHLEVLDLDLGEVGGGLGRPGGGGAGAGQEEGGNQARKDSSHGSGC